MRQFLSFVLIIQVVVSVSAGSRATSNQVQQKQEPINAVTKEDVSTPVESGFTPAQTGSDVLVVTIPRGTVVEIEATIDLAHKR